jgi:hypothetical protein
VGFQDCLDAIWQADALRMVDIRAAAGDDDRQRQLQRGYDQNGHPLCIHGYPMHSNGHDYKRRRTKWCCRKVCLTPQPEGTETQPRPPVPACPYQISEHKVGQVVNVGRTLPDGSVRLAREVAYGSEIWKQRYGRRNLSESRNGSFEHMGLKRMQSFGLTAGRKENAVADFLANLHTLGRLVQEATSLAFKRAAL